MIEELEALAAGQPEGAAVWREIAYSDPARGRGAVTVRLLPVPGRAAGERGDREHDPAGAQPAAEGDEPVLGGVERGGGDPAPSGSVVGPMGRALEQTREAMAKDRRTDWSWEPPECLAELKALDEEDEESTQPSSKKHSKRTAA